jgi:hypothetical protein
VGAGASDQLYRRLPFRFPRLYEELVLSYRWAEVNLDLVELLPNPPGPDLSTLERAIFRDPGLVEVLIPNALVQFGKAGGGHYDPVCFDMRRRSKADAPIVRVEHEAILCHRRLGEVDEIAPSFRDLVERVIARASERRTRRDPDRT